MRETALILFRLEQVIKMNYHEIRTDDILNGENLRCTVFISGCLLACDKCFNPQTWDFKSGKLFDDSATQELLEKLDKPYIAGLTLSGGNPLEVRNIADVDKVVTTVREKFGKAKNIWIYTGYTFEEVMEQFVNTTNPMIPVNHYVNVLQLTDVLVDGRYIDELNDVNFPYRGSTNQRLIDVRKSIDAGKAVLYELR